MAVASFDNESRWYCARAKPGQEHLAITHLVRQGFKPYFPRLQIERWRDGKRTIKHEALFPGYVLVEMVLSYASWRAVNATRGVMKLIGSGVESSPSPIRRGEIEHLRDRDRAGKLRVSEIKRIRPGDEVTVLVGPFAGRTGVCEFTKRERVHFLLQLFDRKVLLAAPLHHLSPVIDRVPEPIG